MIFGVQNDCRNDPREDDNGEETGKETENRETEMAAEMIPRILTNSKLIIEFQDVSSKVGTVSTSERKFLRVSLKLGNDLPSLVSKSELHV